MITILLMPLMMSMQDVTPTPVSRDIAPLVVRSLRDYGKTMAASKATGPILVDMVSLRATARSLGEPFTKASLASVVSDTMKESGRAEAILCDNAGPGGRHQCFVAENGSFIAIDSVRKTAGGVEAYASLTWTDRRRSGVLSLGSQTLRLTFVQSTGGWRLAGRKVLRQT